jgi:hypothetical protein
MQITVPTLGTASWWSRLRAAAAALGLLLVFVFAQAGFAETEESPLNLFKNYFVTGDYVVAGWVEGAPDRSGYAPGTISLPDSKQPSQNGVPATVPKGADIVAAYLYWATVEGSHSSFAGQNAFFNGYSIAGKVLGNPNAPVSWSSGGCSGSSDGSKTMRTYRADVRPYLPLDSSGKVQANGVYQVRLADSGSNGNSTPIALGATLVIIYRVLSPAVPLNSIILYDGAFATSNDSRDMTQPVVGFYQAAQTPIAKITHIVGNGQPNKYENVFLNSKIKLPSLYGKLPPFPGIYNGSWDNPTWLPNNYGTAVNSNDSTATASVLPADEEQGCVSWGAIVFSTTVQDTDHDSLLDVWESNQGYTDVNSNAWVALPGANPAVPDIFSQIDYLNGGAIPHSHLPKQAALDTIGNAFQQHNIKLHFDAGPVYQGDPYVISYPLAVPAGATAPPTGTGGHAIPESSVVCTDSSTAYCEYAGQPVISWKTGFANIKSQNFWRGRKDSYHYVLFGHSLGIPATTWSATGVVVPSTTRGTLVSIVNSGSTGTVTIQTPVQNPPFQIPTSTDRVTVAGAISQFALNGTYYPISIVSQTGTNAFITTVFTVRTVGVADGTYSYSNEPQLAVVFGGPKSTSGFSDLGGGDSLITLGLWRADDPTGCQPDPSRPLTAGQVYCNDQVGSVTVQSGTLMHEAGHTLALTHGGTYYTDSSNPSLPSYGLNCKPNFLSAMNYLFQIRGFPDGGIDYSSQTFTNLNETGLSESAGIGLDSTGKFAVHFTRWYAPPNAVDTKLQSTGGGRYATTHCDGTPIMDGAQMVREDGTTYSSPIDWNNDGKIESGIISPQDVNFNSVIGDVPAFQGFNDWSKLNLSQIGARRNVGGYSGDVSGADIFGGGADIFGGGADIFGGGADIFGGGADIFGGGADVFGGGAELDFTVASSTADPPTGSTCANCVLSSGTLVEKGKSISLAWTPPGFGQVSAYYIWRANGNFPTLASVLANINSFSNIGKVQGSPPVAAFTDNSIGNNNDNGNNDDRNNKTTTYTYFVTDSNTLNVQSGPSAPLTVTVSLTPPESD